jgi:hypothetical protein
MPGVRPENWKILLTRKGVPSWNPLHQGLPLATQLPSNPTLWLLPHSHAGLDHVQTVHGEPPLSSC